MSKKKLQLVDTTKAHNQDNTLHFLNMERKIIIDRSVDVTHRIEEHQMVINVTLANVETMQSRKLTNLIITKSAIISDLGDRLTSHMQELAKIDASIAMYTYRLGRMDKE